MTCANISRGRTGRPAPRSSAKRRSRDGQARALVIGKRPLLLFPGLCHPVNAIVFCHDHGLRHANEPLFLLAIVISPGFFIADSGDRFRFGCNAILRTRAGHHECDTNWSCQHDAEFVHLTPPSPGLLGMSTLSGLAACKYNSRYMSTRNTTDAPSCARVGACALESAFRPEADPSARYQNRGGFPAKACLITLSMSDAASGRGLGNFRFATTSTARPISSSRMPRSFSPVASPQATLMS
jgi:hypothetical protein